MKSQQLTHQPQIRQSNLVVELSRASGDDKFECTVTDLNFIRALGQTFGWQPNGTTYLAQHGQRARLNPIKHDYQPGDSQDSKRVEAADSSHWAAALDAAQRSPFISGMLQKYVQSLNSNHKGAERLLQSKLQGFIQFARRGAFTIALKGAK